MNPPRRSFPRYPVVALLFACLLAAPMIIRMQADQGSEGMSQEEAIRSHGFHLEEVAARSGFSFVHERCEVDPKLEHIAPQIAAMGASASIADVNRDGRMDVYVTTSAFGRENHLYIRQADGTFREMASEYGVAMLNERPEGASMGAIWADVDNDGYEDLFVYRYGRPALFMNRDGVRFEPFSAPETLPAWVNSNSAVWIDYDRDGFVDLFLAGYFHESVNLFDLSDVRMMPDSYEYATNGGRNHLLRNLNGKAFVDVTAAVGLDTRKWTLAATSADLNGDGFTDLVLANDYGVDELFINDAGRRFISAGEASGIGVIPKSGMSVIAADFYNEGVFSLYMTNISEAGVLMQGNNLWVETGRTEVAGVQVPTYVNTATDAGVEIGLWGYSGNATDFNNDGHADLYVANGFYSAQPGTDYWYDYTKVVGAGSQVIIDARNWPAMEERTFSGYQSNRLWLNNGAGRFREVAAAVGGRLDLDSRSVAFGDLFEDGAIDMVVANQAGPLSVYRNRTDPSRSWIRFSLEGSRSNRSAIGATVRIWWDASDQGTGASNTRIQTVSGGEAFSSQSSRVLHFGLGALPEGRIASAEIRWPSGAVQTLGSLEANRLHHIVEPLDASSRPSSPIPSTSMPATRPDGKTPAP